MNNNIVIVDYHMGNLHTVYKKISRLGYQPTISSNPEEIKNASKIILPGVGHFEEAMKNLEELNLIQPLHEAVIEQQTPVLGICLGMQLMTSFSEEGNVKGLNWFPDAKVVRFNQSEKFIYKVPHTGWNGITVNKTTPLFANIEDQSRFYFVHSYHVVTTNEEDVLNTTNYGYDFTSAIHKNNIYGVQYHPEKSHDVGIQLFNNFLEI